MITLYASDESLYACKVRLALRAKGLTWLQRARPDDYAEIVPARTIPAIVDAGFTLAESEAIVEYLEETRPEPPLLPRGAEARARARMLARFHDTRLEPALRQTFPLVGRAAASAFAEPAALISARLAQLAATAAPELAAAPVLGGARLGVADLGYAPCFAWIAALSAACGFAVTWPEPAARYRAALEGDEIVAAEFAGYADAMRGWIDGRLGAAAA